MDDIIDFQCHLVIKNRFRMNYYLGSPIKDNEEKTTDFAKVERKTVSRKRYKNLEPY